MQEKVKIQQIPVKVYRSSDRLMIAAPMPGLQPEDIIVRVTDDNFLVLQGELRGALKDVKDLLIDEWSVGDYYREIKLPDSVDGESANVTYGNGVLVVALPLNQQTVAAELLLAKVGTDRGTHFGNAGHIEINPALKGMDRP